MPEIKKELGELTFISTMDGNHGRGVVWAARELGFKAHIYMPAGSAEERCFYTIMIGSYYQDLKETLQYNITSTTI